MFNFNIIYTTNNDRTILVEILMHHNDLQHDDPIFWSVVTVKAIMNAIINKVQTNKSTIITEVLQIQHILGM